MINGIYIYHLSLRHAIDILLLGYLTFWRLIFMDTDAITPLSDLLLEQSARDAKTLCFNLGTFEGFNFRTQSAINRTLTAAEVVEWNHDKRGEAEFLPSGDRPEVALVFKGRSSVTGSELLELDRLLHELGGDSVEN